MSDISDLIHQYFTTLYGEQEGWVIGGLMDRAGPKGRLTIQKDFYYPEHLEDMVEWAVQFRNQDAYVSPLVYGDMKKTNKDGSTNIRRIPENAISSLVVYQDSDTCPPDKFRLPPTIHVESSAGRYQDYWLLTEPVSASDAADASRRIAIAHRQDGSDPSSWSANKFLRIPGTTNTRHGFPEEVTARFGGQVYDLSEIVETYADVQFEQREIMRLPEDVSYDDVQDLPEYTSALAKLPNTFKMSLITDVPSPSQDRSTLRYRLLCDLFRQPQLSFEEVLAIAWHAPSSQKWREDSRNLRGLIAEALKAQADVAYRAGENFTGFSDADVWVPPVEAERPHVSLLTDAERSEAESRKTFISEYEDYSRRKLGSAFNGPYARMNAWCLLSAALGDFGRLPGSGDRLNFFAMGLGDSGSGKSASRRLWMRAMNELFDGDGSWNLGADASPPALHEKLIERDGKVSFVTADEAHGWFSQLAGATWANGLLEKLAEYYNGHVPPILRASAGRRETSGKSAESTFFIHFMGTTKGEISLPSVMTRAMFYSGFLARFIWYVGEPHEFSREKLRFTNGDGELNNLGFEQEPRQWAAEFNQVKKVLKARTSRSRVEVVMTRDAIERVIDFAETARNLALKRLEWEVIEPSLIRLTESVRKAASLLALSDGRIEANISDVLCAILAAEEWLENLFWITEQVSSSAWAREVDEIEMFLAAKGGESPLGAVYSKFAARQKTDVDKQLEALHAQERATIVEVNGKKVLRLVRKGEE